ncbi:MAG TPA: tetratricopeptide repeat protein [Rhizomicrobium sp.]|nr:tetratricopeptide repeat protein [Rhizomicrobium sp.]
MARPWGPGMTPQLLFQEAVSLHQKGELATAERLYLQTMAAAPENFPARYMFALLLYQQRRGAEALEAVAAALKLNPRDAAALSLRGALLQGVGRGEEALESFDAALAAKPDAAGWYNRGRALQGLGRLEEALAGHGRAVALNPRHADAWFNCGLILTDLKRSEEALAALDKALTLNPDNAEAWKIHGILLQGLHRLKEALASFERCVAISPEHDEAWKNRGHVLCRMKRIPEALASYSRVLEISPDSAETLYTRGMVTWLETYDYDAALSDLERAVRIDPDCPYALGGLLLVKQYGGDWRDFDSAVVRIDAGVRAGKAVTGPFLYQAISQSPADLQACSVLYARDRYPAQIPLARPKPPKSGKIRIGYVSGDFREQATAYLMAGLYECIDKAKFQIIAFDNGWNDGSPIRRRLEAAFDEFIDISGLSDQQAAEKIAARDIGILVSLNGYFGDHRMGVFARRPAPIQVNYLGVPATLGASYMDYIIADRIVIPDEERQFYTEQVVILPDAYQANDSRRAIAEIVPTRAECGLPECGIVFCNFNASYKLTPPAFAAWMRILKQVPDSVLWLLKGNPRFADNLRREAEAQGVAATRIVFAPVIGLAAHLSRLTLADLFLDCLPCNAHTTASDALWAGVPLVTCRGTAFPGRVAASLLHAVGMPELVTESLPDYEKLAVGLASHPAQLQRLRQKLAGNRFTMPLFDTGRFTRNIEIAFGKMWETWRRGEPPSGFGV